MTDPKLFERHPNGMLKKGSGGRVAGSRNKLSHDFVNDALESWKVNGKAAFKIVFHERPHEYLKIMLGIIPREYIMTEGKIDTISEDDLDAALEKILEERKKITQEVTRYDS
jgi:hypothetical protein